LTCFYTMNRDKKTWKNFIGMHRFRGWSCLLPQMALTSWCLQTYRVLFPLKVLESKFCQKKSELDEQLVFEWHGCHREWFVSYFFPLSMCFPSTF
jgi:hypothetical protein